jgi:hypothetical protein
MPLLSITERIRQAILLAQARKRLFAFLVFLLPLSNANIVRIVCTFVPPTFVPLTLAKTAVFFIAATPHNLRMLFVTKGESVGETRES